MNSVVNAIRGFVIWLHTAFTGMWVLYDMWRSIGNVNEKRLDEIQRDARDISGQVVIVTGSNSGIGKQTARELAGRGARVIMACRDPTRAEIARKDILTAIPTAQLEFMQVDMSNLESIRNFVREFQSRYSHLDVLVNNAGILSLDMTTTKDGFDSHIGTNYLGPFLLTLLLLHSLLKANCARIVFLSSTSMALEVLDLDNLMMKDQHLGIVTPYANSKLCVAMFSKQLAKLLSGTAVTTYAVCTGHTETNLFRAAASSCLASIDQVLIRTISSSIEKGAASVLHCVLSKSLSEESGKFYRYLVEWEAADEIIERHNKETLWELSENFTGLKGFGNKFKNDLSRVVSSNK